MFETQTLLRALWAILILFGIWLIASIPAYAALSVWLQLRATLTTLTQTFSTFVRMTFERLDITGERIRIELQQRLRWFEVDSSAKAAWIESIELTWSAAKTNATELTGARMMASNSLKTLQPL